jgi:tetratricopeptide (TPR) repeat protein
MRERIMLTAVLFLSVGGTASAAEKPWLEVRSPHFRVLTNASASDARRVAYEFEQLRAVFAVNYSHFRLDSGDPLVIFAARDEETAKSLAPYMWKTKGVKPGGFFHPGWDKNYALIRLDILGPESQIIVFHEYTHSLMHLNVHWLPVWLDEGLAEFYGYTRFEKKQIYIGAPTERYLEFTSRSLIPVETLLKVGPASPYYHDEDKVDMFYAESWALVHYMVFGPDMNGGDKLRDFLARIDQGRDQKEAFQEVFGSFKEMDKALNAWVHRPGLPAGIVKTPPMADEKDYSAQPLGVAQTNAELAAFHLWAHDVDNARRLVSEALQNDPKLGTAHEEQGFIDFSDGKDADATNEFAQAVADDGNLYLSLFAETMLSPAATSNAPGDEEAFKNALNAVLARNPQYAPAYVQLARHAFRQGDLKAAFAYSRKAEELEPFRAGYHLQTGEILLRIGRNAEAANFAKYVADHWVGPDHNEAMELWNRVPESQRPASDPITESAPKDTQEMEGNILSVTCRKNDDWSFNLDRNGQIVSFHPTAAFSFGFSDTLWYGEDHIALCHHLEGLRAIVHYKPPANISYTGDIVELEIRNDLQAAPAAAAINSGAVTVHTTEAR